MEKTGNRKNEMRFEFEFGTERTHDVITKKVDLHSDEDDLPHLSHAFIDWLISVGFSPEVLSIFLVTACISQSDDHEECVANIIETATAVGNALKDFIGENDEFDPEVESVAKPTLTLQEHIQNMDAKAKTNPIRNVMTYEQFVAEFQQEESFRKFMYMLYAGEMSE